MAFLKISPDLFLGAAELNRFEKFLDTDGFRKNILDNSVSFGLIKSNKDTSFSNGRVERDLDTGLGQKTIKVRELSAIDKFGDFLHSDPVNGIPVPNDGNWYWVKAFYATTTLEKGKFSISGNGDLVCTSGDAELTKIFRGMPNFPTRIRFSNSYLNTLEYDVLDVIDDQHATLQHPATSNVGISEFTEESNLTIEIIGTFTLGIAAPTASKKPFVYDSATITLLQETISNTPPAYTSGADFYLARVKATGSTVIIQDRRVEYWETKGSNAHLEIERKDNPCIGVESVQYNNEFSAADRNIVKMAWGMRSNNWSIDSSNNIITFNSGLGGKYKTVNDFQNNDFVGGRLYAPNGKYGKIIGSVKQGSAINFTLDVLDINNFSGDGGSTLISGYAIAVPDCDSVEIKFTPDPAANVPAIEESFVFPVNELVGRCDVLAFADPDCLYNVSYRYKTIKEFTQYKPIPSDTTIGYFNEDAFNTNGNISDATKKQTYTSDATNGFIKLKLYSKSISKFRQKVDKGDLIGVNHVDLNSVSVVNLIVGTTDNYIYIDGDVTLNNDVVFNLITAGAVKGNEFRVHFKCASLDLNGHSLKILQNLGLTDALTLKQVEDADIYQMLQQDGGICFDCKFNGDRWVMYQNYDIHAPYDLRDVINQAVDAALATVGLLGRGSINIPDIFEFQNFTVTHNLHISGEYIVVGSLVSTSGNINNDNDLTFVVANLTSDSFVVSVQELSNVVNSATFSYLIFKK